MTGSGLKSVPLLLLQLTFAGWGIVELGRFVLEWRRTGLSGDARSSIVVAIAIVAAAWLDGVCSRLNLLRLPGAASFYLWLSLVLVWLGLALRAWAAVSLGRLYSTTVLIQEGHYLVTSGPYAVVRHPSFAGLCLALLGLAVAGGSGAALLATVAVLAAGLGYRIRVEEQALRGAFGREYEAYAARTRRLLPGVW